MKFVKFTLLQIAIKTCEINASPKSRNHEKHLDNSWLQLINLASWNKIDNDNQRKTCSLSNSFTYYFNLLRWSLETLLSLHSFGYWSLQWVLQQSTALVASDQVIHLVTDSN